MGIRVDAASLMKELGLNGQLDSMKLHYHGGIADGTLLLSIGGG